MKKKILMGTKNANDTTSFLRAWGAFSTPEMRKECEIIRQPEGYAWVSDWTYFLSVDAVYIHRPSIGVDFHIIEKCKQMGIPLWVDMDDDLENIEPSNPVFANYSGPETKQVIDHAIKEADILSVGGEIHAQRIEKQYNRKVHLIPNAVDDRLLGLKKPFSINRKIAWRGSESHRVDLFFFQKEIERIMNDFPDLYWTFIGLNPYMFTFNERPNVVWSPPMNLFDYYTALTSLNATFHMVPMIDNQFNRVKSNLAWSDATLAGSVCLGPSLPEYIRPGVWHYDPNQFHYEFENMLQSSDQELRDFHDTSWEWIRDNILMSKVNQTRIEILRNL